MISENNENIHLIQTAKQGNPDALNTLLKAYREGVYQYAMSVLGEHAQADEATQETLIYVWQHIAESPDTPTEFRLWLQAVCKNNNKSVRRRLVQDHYPSDTLERIASPVAVWSTMGSPYPADENPIPEFDPHQYLSLLPRRERQCLKLQLKGKSIGQIAYMLRISKRTVHNNLFRARKKMRQIRKVESQPQIPVPIPQW